MVARTMIIALAVAFAVSGTAGGQDTKQQPIPDPVRQDLLKKHAEFNKLGDVAQTRIDALRAKFEARTISPEDGRREIDAIWKLLEKMKTLKAEMNKLEAKLKLAVLPQAKQDGKPKPSPEQRGK
jgi:hypothetical protein